MIAAIKYILCNIFCLNAQKTQQATVLKFKFFAFLSNAERATHIIRKENVQLCSTKKCHPSVCQCAHTRETKRNNKRLSNIFIIYHGTFRALCRSPTPQRHARLLTCLLPQMKLMQMTTVRFSHADSTG